MMKRLAALAVLLCLMAAAGCKGGTKETSSDPSWDQVALKKELVVGVYADRAPMTCLEGDGYTGFDIDMMTEIAARLSLSVRFVAVDEQGVWTAISTGQADCVCSGYAYSADRSEAFTLSEAYLTSRQVFAVRSDSGAKNIADLEQATLGVGVGSMAQRAINSSETFRDALAEVKQYDSEDQALHALLTGEIDVAAVSETLVRNAVRGGDDLRVILDGDEPETLGTEDYVIAVGRGNDSLMKKIQDALSTMKRDGVLDTLSLKWFSNYLSAADQKAADQAADASDAEEQVDDSPSTPESTEE